MVRRGKEWGIERCIFVVVAGLLVLFFIAPSEIWVVIAVLISFALGIYVYIKSKVSRRNLPFEEAARSVGIFPNERGNGEVLPRSASSARDFRIPSAPKHFGSATWIPAGESFEVAGVTIPDGLVYVGTSLPTLAGENAPSLIDPSKSLALNGDYKDLRAGYWPSYSEISPYSRRAYLNWLADGRKDPDADIGYVFIFFYGLERRAILDSSKDSSARGDWPAIAAELRRLLKIYGVKSRSFRNYASSLLDWVSLAECPEKAYLKDIPIFPKTHEIPIYIRVALGQAAVDGVPVPAQLALAWVKLDPATPMRTPAIRCPAEFDKLFALKYHEIFGRGLVLPRNKTKIKLVHRPASVGLNGYKNLSLSFGSTPDVTALTVPIKKLRQVVDMTTKELEPFSRYVGRNPDASNSLEGFLQLPVLLWPESIQVALLALKSRIGNEVIVMPFRELLDSLGAKAALTRNQVATLARALESLSIGIEPDILGGARLPKLSENVALFSEPLGTVLNRATPAYQAALLALDLAGAVAAADGEFSLEEMVHVKEQIQSWANLTPSHISRLLAHLHLLRVAPPSLTLLRKKLDLLDIGAKETIAVFMTSVAQSDGGVSPTEVKMLEKVYRAFGVEPKRVFSDIHAVAAGTNIRAENVADIRDTGFKLDPERIATLQKDTDAVMALLSGVFKEDNPPEPVFIYPEPEGDTDVPSPGLLGLDEAHSTLARLLLSRPDWTKDELGDVATDLDLMIEGAIETLNEAAFDRYDLPFIEGEDVMTVNPEILEKLEA